MSLHPPQRKEKPIENLTEALKLHLDKIGGRVVRTESGAKGPMSFVLSDGKGHLAYLFFKRDWLHSYEYLFPQEAGRGWGQTVNYNILQKAARDNAFLVIINPRGFIYSCMAAEFLRYVEEHKTIRRPSEEIGLEASVPSTMLKRVEVA